MKIRKGDEAMSATTETEEAFKLQERSEKRDKVLKKYHCDKKVREILSKFPYAYKVSTSPVSIPICDIKGSFVAQWGLVDDFTEQKVALISLKECILCGAFHYGVEILLKHPFVKELIPHIDETPGLLKSELKDAVNRIFKTVYGKRQNKKGFISSLKPQKFYLFRRSTC